MTSVRKAEEKQNEKLVCPVGAVENSPTVAAASRCSVPPESVIATR